ncbi:MAG: DNA-3-methyladenine glycosylase 2 [Ruminococcaceae bacterium]|nr:DNA-3-methyladenine glycosylase 2 [Oscillospiraceae bacterium]
MVMLKNIDNFDLKKTFECGQCFRWEQNENGFWQSIVGGKEINASQDDTNIVLFPCSKEDFDEFWFNYFDLGRDYSAINEVLNNDKTLKNAVKYGKGIRILNQEPWETLCSFIISQNNNIPRIKGIISRLCENFGEKKSFGYTFPSAEKIASLSVDDLAVLRSGFRAKYIIDAAKKVTSGTINLDELKKLDSDSAREILTTIYGVGEKVADCTLLFGLGHTNVFPKDVWIKRALSVLYNGKFPDCALNYEGIAQQYLFYYARETKLNV